MKNLLLKNKIKYIYIHTHTVISGCLALFVEPAHRLRVGQRPKPVVVLLSRRVPQTQVDRFPVHHDIGRVVVKPGGGEEDEVNSRVLWRFDDSQSGDCSTPDLHCGDVLPREGVGGVADEQACFTHSPEVRKHSIRTEPALSVTCWDFSCRRI